MDRYLIILIIFISTTELISQDPSFTQAYAIPMITNPAFVGATQVPRAKIAYRRQWAGIPANYDTYVAAFDHFIPQYNLGIGIIATNDIAGSSKLRTTNIGAAASYEIGLTDRFKIIRKTGEADQMIMRFGLQFDYGQRSIAEGSLIFEDQMTSGGFTGAPTQEAGLNGNNTNYVDISSGVLLSSRHMWLGLAAHHMNRPDVSLLTEGTDELPLKMTYTAGYIWDVNKKIDNIKLSAIFKTQGPHNQLNVGTHIDFNPVLVGMWYRGGSVFGGDVGSFSNYDAVAFLVGFKWANISFMYSYDVTISQLGYETSGAHEFSMSYNFVSKDKYKNKSGTIPICPRAQRAELKNRERYSVISGF